MAKSKPRSKMSISERAKQFAPFSPLSGLEAALAEREKRKEPKRILDEDAASALNDVLTSLKRGDVITVFFYNSELKCYEQVEGAVNIIDQLKSRLFVCGREIFFDDLYEIEKKNVLE